MVSVCWTKKEWTLQYTLFFRVNPVRKDVVATRNRGALNPTLSKTSVIYTIGGDR